MKRLNLLFIILCCMTAFLLFQNCNQEDSSTTDEKSTDEIIKEHLGENMKFEDMPDTMQVAHMVRVWNGCHNEKFVQNLENLYADQVVFYGENRSSAEAIQTKRRLLGKYPDYFQRIIGGIKVKKTGSDEYRCDFTKFISVGRVTAPVPSYIIFKKVADNQWKIIAESDPETDTKVQTMKDSMLVLKEMFSPSSSEIKGNFSGKGDEKIFVFPPDNSDCSHCVTSLFFSNELLPPIDIEGVKTAQLLNEGDLDGDGNDEFSTLTKTDEGGYITIYSYKRGKWDVLKKFKTDYDRVIDDADKRKELVQFAGSGYIYILEQDGDTSVQEKVNIWNF